MPSRRCWTLLGLCLLCGNPSAQTEPDEETGQELDPISLEFLEFLGAWETPDGEWLDPNELNDETTEESTTPEAGDE